MDTGPLQSEVGLRLPGGPAPAGSLADWRSRAANILKVVGAEAPNAIPVVPAAEAKAATTTAAAAAAVRKCARAATWAAGCGKTSMVGQRASTTEGRGQHVAHNDKGRGSGDGGVLLVDSSRDPFTLAARLHEDLGQASVLFGSSTDRVSLPAALIRRGARGSLPCWVVRPTRVARGAGMAGRLLGGLDYRGRPTSRLARSVDGASEVHSLTVSTDAQAAMRVCVHETCNVCIVRRGSSSVGLRQCGLPRRRGRAHDAVGGRRWRL